MLVVVCGLPGVGKTTVAEHASERLDGTLLRTDVVRKELFPDPEYTDAEAAAVYDELFARASEELARGGAGTGTTCISDDECRGGICTLGRDLMLLRRRFWPLRPWPLDRPTGRTSRRTNGSTRNTSGQSNTESTVVGTDTDDL